MADYINFYKVLPQEGFWLDKYNTIKTSAIESIKKRFEETGRFDAIRFNCNQNQNKIHFFYDSDVAKWIESVAYFYKMDKQKMQPYVDFCDQLIDCMKKAQMPNGYLNSYHQQVEPENIFKIRDHHELYCLGHLIESAIAYHDATGKSSLLQIVEKYIDLVEKVFMIENCASFVTPGHQEIELALFKLYRYTNNAKYKNLAEFFLKMRANNTKDDIIYWGAKNGAQDDCTIYELKEANGHAVRALYYYTGIADLAFETNDNGLIEALVRIWNDITNYKMYITGGTGSTHTNESFTTPYDLPNATAYAESCAGIALINYAMRMRKLFEKSEYADVIERVVYNVLLSSVSLDGKSYFYENPLEISLCEYGREKAVPPEFQQRLPIKQRLEVFNCSCCPPNITRCIAQIYQTICYNDKNALFVEQFISSTVKTDKGDLKLLGNYPMQSEFIISSNNYTAKYLYVRIPAWCNAFKIVNNSEKVPYKRVNGYAKVKVERTFELKINFNIKPNFIASNPRVHANSGKIALTYGPVVYCVEGVDNAYDLNALSFSLSTLKNAKSYKDFHGLYSIEVNAFCDLNQNSLYFDARKQKQKNVLVKFIPYFAFANRGESDMKIWVRKK